MGMTTDHDGYLGFGTSINNKMVPSDAVIGIGNPSFRVDRYDMIDKSDPGVLRMDAEYQTLVNASFVRDGDTGGRILSFTKLLVDEKEYVYENGIDADGRTTFIWAVGFNDVLGIHRYHGQVELPLKPCDVEDTSDDDTEDAEENEETGVVVITEANANKAFVAHGILALMAIGLLLPIGIASSAARNSPILQQPTTWKNSPKWMVLHQLCNGTSYLLFLILFVLSFAAQYYESDRNTDSPWNGHLESTHHKMGYVIFILMTLQVVLAIFRPSKVQQNNDEKEQGLEEGGTEHNDESFTEHDSSTQKANDPTVTTTSIRRIWELKHLVIGYALLALSLYQCHGGLKRLTLKGYTDYTIALWIYVSCVAALLIVGVYYLKRQ